LNADPSLATSNLIQPKFWTKISGSVISLDDVFASQ